MKKILSLLLVFTIFATCMSSAVFAADDNPDLQKILKQIETSTFKSRQNFSIVKEGMIDLLGEDGKFSDLDYSNRNGKFDHIKRICGMAWHFYSTDGILYKNGAAANKILKGLRWFMEQKYGPEEVGPNGVWTASMDTPWYIAETMIALRAAGMTVPDDLYNLAVTYHFELHNIEENNVKGFCYNISNLAYLAQFWRRAALLTGDERWINDIYRELPATWEDHVNGEYGELGIDAGIDQAGGRLGVTYFGDGAYPDGSYLGHGPFPYTWGYGNQFISNTMGVVTLAVGTKYQAPPEKLKVLVDIVIDSFTWTVRGDHMDLVTLGRDTSGPDIGNDPLSGRKSRILSYCNSLLQEPTIPRRDELEAMRDRLSLPGNNSYVIGNQARWLSDHMYHHRDNYMAALRFPSIRTLRAEKVAREGTMGYYMSDGTLQLMVDGDEYSKATPVWDWDRLPGLTAVNSVNDPPVLEELSNVVNTHYGTSEFCGGVSDGMYGAATMELNDKKTGVDVKKSWFLFDDEVVALGTDISSTAAENVFTNLNQCLLDGDVVYGNGDTETVLDAQTEKALGSANWVYHDKIGYVLPEEGQNAFISNKSQTGNGSRKDDVQTRKMVTKDIFSMYINHGTAFQDGKFSYIAVPGTTKDAVKEYAKNIPIQIVQNDEKIQAVYHKELKILQAVFREAGEITLDTGLKVEVDTPCLLMVKAIDGGYMVYTQNPKNEKVKIGFKINEKFEADFITWDEKTQMSSMIITNRNGIYAGQTVTTNLTTKLISNISYNGDADSIDFDGVIPAKNAKYIFAKITNEKGESFIESAEIKSDSTYKFSVPANELAPGKYSIILYCENEMEPLSDEIIIEKTIPDAPVIFSDTINHWCRDYAARMALYGVLNGDGNGRLRPDQNISLAELLKILIKSAESCDPEVEKFYQGFDTFETGIMKYAARNELLPQSIINLNLKPTDPVNRQEMITILMHAAEKYGWLSNYQGEAVETPYDIDTVNHWAFAAVDKAVGLGIVQGSGDGLHPFDYSKRAECIKIIEKLIAQYK